MSDILGGNVSKAMQEESDADVSDGGMNRILIHDSGQPGLLHNSDVLNELFNLKFSLFVRK